MNAKEWLAYLAYCKDIETLSRIGELFKEAKKVLPVDEIIPDFELVESMIKVIYDYRLCIKTLQENGACFWKDRANPQCICNGDCEYKAKIPVPVCYSCVHFLDETSTSCEGKYVRYKGTCPKHIYAGNMLKCPDYTPVNKGKESNNSHHICTFIGDCAHKSDLPQDVCQTCVHHTIDRRGEE